MKKFFPGLALIMISSNIKGLTTQKGIILTRICNENKFNALCVQKMHRDQHHTKSNVEGKRFVTDRIINIKSYGIIF